MLFFNMVCLTVILAIHPIYARRRNLTSATFFWPGSEVRIRGLRPNFFKKYNGSTPFEERVEQSINWLEQGGAG
jgi:hypothetical protein